MYIIHFIDCNGDEWLFEESDYQTAFNMAMSLMAISMNTGWFFIECESAS